jgi:hypothetical protein
VDIDAMLDCKGRSEAGVTKAVCAGKHSLSSSKLAFPHLKHGSRESVIYEVTMCRKVAYTLSSWQESCTWIILPFGSS